MSMRILVTGATGFLGEPLTRRLLTEGHEVRVIARNPEKAAALRQRGATVVRADITDAAALHHAAGGVAVVYHLAGHLLTPGTPTEEYRRTHVEGTAAVLACCRESPTLRRFVHCSTTGVLGATGAQPVAETASYAPTTVYEATKMEAEVLVRAAGATGFPATIARPGLVYGPGDRHLLGFFRSIQRRMFRPIGRAPVWLHPIYIDDLVEGLTRCATRAEAAGECFHLAGAEPVTLAQLAQVIAGALGVAPARARLPLSMAWPLAQVGDALPRSLRGLAPLTRSRLEFLTRSRVYDVGKAACLLDFRATTPLLVGIASTVAWYRRHGLLPAQALVADRTCDAAAP